MVTLEKFISNLIVGCETMNMCGVFGHSYEIGIAGMARCRRCGFLGMMHVGYGEVYPFVPGIGMIMPPPKPETESQRIMREAYETPIRKKARK
jgi:hypothetical protein